MLVVEAGSNCPQFRGAGFGSAATDRQMIEHRNERRAAPRHQVLKGATIAFGGNGLACTVHNLSAGGAALDFASSISLPPSFMLVIKADQFIRRCRPVWSRDKRIGVAFD
jgi:hypothetical protein